MNSKIRNHIYLAAMLHDIGKFYQRADTGSVQTSQHLTSVGKNEKDFCPVYKGRYSHKHVLWTAQFIDDFSQVFNNLLGSDSHDLSDKNNLMNLAASHHLSKEQLTKWGRIIKEADCLSSGMDRDSEESMKDDQDENDWNSFKKKRMISILETIGLPSIEGKSTWQHIPLSSLKLTNECFPQSEFNSPPDYNTLWTQFVNEFKFIQANTYHAFSETLLNLLYKYTTSIPSSTINFPDVSLYDHLKTTAALALCLYDVYESGETPEDRFLLIGADFSGIQSYIYEIVSKYAGKNLKGRSYYIRMLSDAVVRYLLKQLNLYQANIVYNSGGSFYILAPNTEKIRHLLETSIKTIEDKIFKAHKTSLFIAIDSIPLSDKALMHLDGNNLSAIWSQLYEKRDRKKQCRYSELIKTYYSAFFCPIQQGGDCARDIITGEELPNSLIYSEGDLSPLSKESKQQIVLGKKLRDYEVIVISEEKIPYWNNHDSINPADLGFYYYFMKRSDLEKMKQELRSSADRVTVVTPNGENGNCDFMGKVDGIDNIYALDFYGGNEIISKRIPTFEEMCNKHYAQNKLSRLGVLRMDVDNLGYIFQKGIIPKRATLSRFASLSRSFDFFFSGYLNSIWKDILPQRSIIIYSGGDDVFIVGSWEVTIEIAKKVHKDFSLFTCGNSIFSISGGIALVPPKFPIMKAAYMSAEEESRAKSHIAGNQMKNSISFMNMPLNWVEEFPFVEELKDSIVNLNCEELITKSFISKILAHASNASFVEHAIQNYKTYWMLTYDLGRMKKRVKDYSVKSLIDQCIKDICKNKNTLNGKKVQTNYHPLELWAFACRWAELEMRTYNI